MNINSLKKYMKDNFNITPKNIDRKLEEKRQELKEKIKIMGGIDNGKSSKSKAS